MKILGWSTGKLKQGLWKRVGRKSIETTFDGIRTTFTRPTAMLECHGYSVNLYILATVLLSL